MQCFSKSKFYLLPRYVFFLLPNLAQFDFWKSRKENVVVFQISHASAIVKSTYLWRAWIQNRALKNLLQLNRTLTKRERGLCYLRDYTYQTLTHVFNEPATWKFLETVSAVLIRWRWSDHVGWGLNLVSAGNVFTDWTDAIQRLSAEFSMRLSIFHISFFFFIHRFFLYLSSSVIFLLSFLLTFRSLICQRFTSIKHLVGIVFTSRSYK